MQRGAPQWNYPTGWKETVYRERHKSKAQWHPCAASSSVYNRRGGECTGQAEEEMGGWVGGGWGGVTSGRCSQYCILGWLNMVPAVASN